MCGVPNADKGKPQNNVEFYTVGGVSQCHKFSDRYVQIIMLLLWLLLAQFDSPHNKALSFAQLLLFALLSHC